MSWQSLMIMQIIVSSLTTIYARRISLINRKLFFATGALLYTSVAVMGLVYMMVLGHTLPKIPNATAWHYIIIEGILIPVAWLLQYKIISKLGASNAVIITALNTVGVALMGIIFLHDTLTAAFIVGAGLVLASIATVFRVQPDIKHRQAISKEAKIGLIALMFITYSVGMFFEKKAIQSIGVWDYACFGWSMQCLTALTICYLNGRNELKHLKKSDVKRGLTLGFITSISGGLYIYALSKSTLSKTIIATSGKTALTMLLAAYIFKERNALSRRFIALGLSVIGLYFIFT